ncbi:ribosomal protein S5 domain 2-type protein [Kockiozyma suomiensis]|uniref:ribosomal protein S5 domain 2-type protein n=1 Tax=Kockiozyma suomiensis TaxID=1337062 RepID=UPI0033430823
MPSSTLPVAERYCFSAPGKALFAGGYLVLYPENSSFVTALSARIYALISPSQSLDTTRSTVTVLSPQFAEGEWSYNISRSSTTGFVTVSAVNLSRKNPFAQAAVTTILNYLSATGNLPMPIPSLTINILSDNAYHSQPHDNVPRFNTHSQAISAVPKTGLGSSAALTTVLTAALLSYYGNVGRVTENKRLLHNLAQIAHCTAQGKVGSGFDVACAVYGSIVYQRFLPSIISAIPVVPNELDDAKGSEYLHVLKNTIESNWNVGTAACAIPPRLRLLMGDISGGSETPAMVQMVQQWRREGGADAESTWTSLGKANQSLISAMIGLQGESESNPKEYAAVMDQIIDSGAGTSGIKTLGVEIGGKIGGLIQQAVDSITEIRHHLRAITKGSGAQIEPEQQTRLLDACNELPGVFGGVVPGAGGYDAICLLVTEASVDRVVNATNDIFANVKWLELREESVGLREEAFPTLAEYL